jgi:hypothetical protein
VTTDQWVESAIPQGLDWEIDRCFMDQRCILEHFESATLQIGRTVFIKGFEQHRYRKLQSFSSSSCLYVNPGALCDFQRLRDGMQSAGGFHSRDPARARSRPLPQLDFLVLSLSLSPTPPDCVFNRLAVDPAYLHLRAIPRYMGVSLLRRLALVCSELNR